MFHDMPVFIGFFLVDSMKELSDGEKRFDPLGIRV